MKTAIQWLCITEPRILKGMNLNHLKVKIEREILMATTLLHQRKMQATMLGLKKVRRLYQLS